MSKQLPVAKNQLPALVDGAAEKMGDVLATSADLDKQAAFDVGMDLGRLQGLDFILTVGASAQLQIYENVKKSKAWRVLRNPKSSHGKNFESLEEFCEVKLGKSYKRLQSIKSNRDTLGQEAYAQAEELGLRQIDHNAIKALPAPDQELIRQAVQESTSREQVLDLLQELAARHSTTQAELTNKVEELQKNYDAKGERNADLTKEVEALKTKLSKEKLTKFEPNKFAQALLLEIHQASGKAEGEISSTMRQGFQKLKDHTDEHGGNFNEVLSGYLLHVEAACQNLREEFGMKRQLDDVPAWLAAQPQA